MEKNENIMNIKVILLSLVTLTVSLPLFADIPVGTWRSHLSYRNVTMVEETPTQIFALADGHLFSCNKIDKVITKYSKINGFSDNSVNCIKYDWQSASLVVAYKNANIDIVTGDGDIISVPDIKNKTLAVDKSINSVSFYKSNAYISTNFGVVVLNLNKYEVKDTYIIGDKAQMKPVYSVTSDGKNLYALMDGVIKVAPVSGKNLLDYKNWSAEVLSLPDVSKMYSELVFYNGRFILCEVDGDIWEYSDGEWKVLFKKSIQGYSFIHLSNNILTVSCGAEKYVIDQSWRETGPYIFGCKDAVIVDNTFWLAQETSGLGYISLDEGLLHSVVVDGPVLGSSQRIYCDKGRIVVAPGGAWIDRKHIDGAIMFFENEQWVSYTAKETGVADISPDGWFMDVVSIAVDPNNPNRWFAATWGEGIYEFIDGKAVKLHNYYSTGGVLKPVSSILEPGLLHYTRVDGLVFDEDGTLWAICSRSSTNANEKVVVYMTSDNVWHEASGYTSASTFATAQQILIHTNKQKWVRSARYKPGLIVKSDKSSKFFSSFTDTDGNSITPSFVYDMAEDGDGTVWVGTNEGPILFQNVGDVFNSSYRVTRIKIPRNDGSGLADYLLSGISVKSIAVDGGNRKWIGTENAGLYLISADGLTSIAHFTVENSPLPSNEITSIAINPANGSVFIGTADGIVEYRDGVTNPEKELSEKKIKVFPNPVNPDYNGLITVTGLEDKTEVRVVNASGYLVYSGVSVGGTFIWNGKNFQGDNVSGGVYFFHLMNTQENNSRSTAAKVLIIR